MFGLSFYILRNFGCGLIYFLCIEDNFFNVLLFEILGYILCGKRFFDIMSLFCCIVGGI